MCCVKQGETCIHVLQYLMNHFTCLGLSVGHENDTFVAKCIANVSQANASVAGCALHYSATWLDEAFRGRGKGNGRVARYIHV